VLQVVVVVAVIVAVAAEMIAFVSQIVRAVKNFIEERKNKKKVKLEKKITELESNSQLEIEQEPIITRPRSQYTPDPEPDNNKGPIQIKNLPVPLEGGTISKN